MKKESEPMDQGVDIEQNSQVVNESTLPDLAIPHRDIEPLRDAEIDRLIELLSRPTQALTTEEYLENIEERQEAVSQHLLRGGVKRLGGFLKELDNSKKDDL